MNPVEQQIAEVLPTIFADGPELPVPDADNDPDTIPQGKRDDTLTRLAGQLRRIGLPAETIVAALRVENQRRCKPPLSDFEITKIARSIGRYASQGESGSSGLSEDGFADAYDVAAEGRAIAAAGVQYLVDGIVPNYGMLGMNIAYAKVGKTTWGQRLGASVATGRAFLDRTVRQARVLALCPEDPPEYTAWLARHLDVPPDTMTFYRRPFRFDQATLDDAVDRVRHGQYGLVLVASWQAVVAGLVKDENDNAGAVAIVERVKLAARATGIPWLIDAHSGKGEDQSDDADPTRAMRGASAAAGAADYMLSLRYADGAFSSRRRLSGKGRFVSLEPVLLDYDISSGTFTALGSGRSVSAESTWHLIQTTGILQEWSTADAIALAIGLVSPAGNVTGAGRRRVKEALRGRLGIDIKSERRRGQETTLFRLSEAQ